MIIIIMMIINYYSWIIIVFFHVYQRVMIDYTGWIKWYDSEMMGEYVD
jgi:hypothetical protein